MRLTGYAGDRGLVLETESTTDIGVVRLVDCMPSEAATPNVSFWLTDNRALMGRKVEGGARPERLLALRLVDTAVLASWPHPPAWERKAN